MHSPRLRCPEREVCELSKYQYVLSGHPEQVTHPIGGGGGDRGAMGDGGRKGGGGSRGGAGGGANSPLMHGSIIFGRFDQTTVPLRPPHCMKGGSRWLASHVYETLPYTP